MDEEYNVISSSQDDDLAYPCDDDGAETTALSALNCIERRSQKRPLMLDNDENLLNPMDWHLRMPLTLEEREAKRAKQLLEDEVLDRTTQRILEARRRRTNETVVLDASASAGNAMDDDITREKILQYPPTDGSAWVGVSSVDNAERFYLKMRPRWQFILSLPKRRFDFERFDRLETEANELERTRSNRDVEMTTEEESVTLGSGGSELWFSKYKPSTYGDLLSDDTVNRHVLMWLKLWDECVFKKRIANTASLVGDQEKAHFALDSGKPRRPQQKILLLAGPAGLGKTTMANVLSLHAGYTTVEVNASDSRNVADFEKVLEGAARSTRTLDSHKRPICLVMDEIDGAPIEAVRCLIRAVSATGKKAIRRPIICICNNLFTPSLRELRNFAYTIQVNPVRRDRLTQRLETICMHESLKIDSVCLKRLTELVNNDVRLSLNSLQLLAATGGPSNSVTVSQVEKAVERERNGAVSIFDAWSTVLELSKHLDKKGIMHGPDERCKLVLKAVEDADERFVSGLHANYLLCTLPIATLSQAANTFLFYDRIQQTVNESQNYTFRKYLMSFFISLHLTVATHTRLQLKYPQADYQWQQKRRECNETLSVVGERVLGSSRSPLVLDVLPLVVTIVQPPIKSVNQSLYSSREWAQIETVVRAMSAYGLTFAPQLVKGETHFLFQPAIDVLTMFDVEDANRHLISNAARQMIANLVDQYNVKKSFGERQKEHAQLSIASAPASALKKFTLLHYKFNQGYSNAVKKTIRMSQLVP